MTIATVPLFPKSIGTDGIKAGVTIYGSTWKTAQDIANYLTAKGGQLVLANTPKATFAAGAHILHYYSWPRAVHTQRVWVLHVKSLGAACPLEVSDAATNPLVTNVFGNVGGLLPWNVTTPPPPALIYVGTHAASSTPAALDLDLLVGAAGIRVESVACFELPLKTITVGASANAVVGCGAGYTISGTDEYGLYGLAQSVAAGATNQRRALLSWYDPTGFTTTSASFVDIFALPPKVNARRGSNADGTTKTVAWAARVATTGGACEVKVTAASGGTSTLTPDGAAAWYTGTVAVDREDLTDVDSGGQATRLFGDTLTFQAKIVAPATEMTVTGICMSEAL
jgi:hypothetical protein